MRQTALTENEIEKAVIRASWEPLADKLSRLTGTGKKEIVKLLDSLTAIAYRETRKNGEFVIPGIGKLVRVSTRVGHRGRRGTRRVTAPAKAAVKFHVSKVARDSVLGKRRAI